MAAFLAIMYIIGVALAQLIPTAIAIILTVLFYKKIKNIKIEDDLFRE